MAQPYRWVQLPPIRAGSYDGEDHDTTSQCFDEEGPTFVAPCTKSQSLFDPQWIKILAVRKTIYNFVMGPPPPWGTGARSGLSLPGGRRFLFGPDPAGNLNFKLHFGLNSAELSHS